MTTRMMIAWRPKERCRPLTAALSTPTAMRTTCVRAASLSVTSRSARKTVEPFGPCASVATPVGVTWREGEGTMSESQSETERRIVCPFSLKRQ